MLQARRLLAALHPTRALVCSYHRAQTKTTFRPGPCSLDAQPGRGTQKSLGQRCSTAADSAEIGAILDQSRQDNPSALPSLRPPAWCRCREAQQSAAAQVQAAVATLIALSKRTVNSLNTKLGRARQGHTTSNRIRWLAELPGSPGWSRPAPALVSQLEVLKTLREFES